MPRAVGRHLVVDVLEIGGLAAEPGAVVHELAVDLARGVVDHRHARRSLRPRRVCRSRLPPRPGTPTPLPAHSVPSRLNMSVKTWLSWPTAGLDPELHQAQRRAVVEQHDQDDPPRHVRQVHRLPLALVEQRAELGLAEHPGQLVVGAEVGRRERGERGRVERAAPRRRWPPSARCGPRSARSARSTRRESRSGSPGCAGRLPPGTTSSTTPLHLPRRPPHARVASRPPQDRLRRGAGAPAGAPRRGSPAAAGRSRRRSVRPGSRARRGAGAGAG